MSMATPTTHHTSEWDRDEGEPALFDRDELRQFAADDTEAGRRIAKILAALFIYTLIAMSIATWWTFRTVGH